MYVHSLYEVAATGTTVCVDTACTVQTALYNITAVFCHPLRSNEEQGLVDCKKKKKKSLHAKARKHAHVREHGGLVRISH